MFVGGEARADDTATYRASVTWPFSLGSQELMVDFANTGHVENNLDLPHHIAVVAASDRGAGANLVSKYNALGEVTGVDLLAGVTVIVATDGNDTMKAADGVSQTLFGMEGNDLMVAGTGVPDPEAFGRATDL